MATRKKHEIKELAYYYPNPMWANGDWIKNLILFFDGVALLVPNYMKKGIESYDPAIIAGLKAHDLLHIIEPEIAVDKAAAEKLAQAMTDIIASGALDKLSSDSTAFAEISMSRLGYYGSAEIGDKIFRELETRKLATKTKDGLSIPMHPLVRYLVLTLLAQILRPYGRQLAAELNPITDQQPMIDGLIDLLEVPTAPSKGNVIAFDLAIVGVNLSAVPIDEVLSFRKQNGKAYMEYSRSVRRFAFELSLMSPKERKIAFEERQEELNDLAADLCGKSRKAWKKPATIGLGLAGAAWVLSTGDIVGAILAASGTLATAGLSMKHQVGAYSYLFTAGSRFRC